MIYVGMDVHQSSTTFCLFDPALPEGRRHRTVTQPATAEGIRAVLKPLKRQCQVVFEIGTQTQTQGILVQPTRPTYGMWRNGPLRRAPG